MEFRAFPGSGIIDATLFSDSLGGADQPFIWGTLYHCGVMAGYGATGVADQLAAKINRSAGNLVFSGGGGGSIIFRMNGIPIPLSFLQVDGKPQFAQVNIVSDGSAGVNCNAVGVAVFTLTNQSSCYALRKNPQGTTAGVQLVRCFAGADTFLGAIHAVAANDLVRIEVRPAAGGVNNLRLLINGATLENLNDTSAIVQGGMPSLDCAALFSGAQLTNFANFSCGLLTS